jgi:hypothetical protein
MDKRQRSGHTSGTPTYQKKAAEQQREADVIRHETELRRGQKGPPGATSEQWAKARDAILAADRKEQAIKYKDAA